MRRLRLLLILMLGLQLPGCATYSLETLRHTTPSGTPFQNALATLYMDFAQAEEQKYDWSAAMRFGDKGLQSAYGKDTVPETLGDWNLKPAAVAELAQAREQLMQYLTPAVEKAQPEAAARAQFYFDCWVENQSDDVSKEDINDCRDHFTESLALLSEAVGHATLGDEPGNKHHGGIEQPVPAPEHVKTQQKDAWLVFFAWDKSVLTKAGQDMVEEIVVSLKKLGTYDVVLGGHTDRAGSAKYNLRLSQQRAQVVKDQLVRGGIDSDKIHIFAYGESDPLVKTADGVPNARNRRVEILLNQ